MKLAIIGDAARKNYDAPLIEKAPRLFDEVVYAPISEIRIKTGNGNRIIHGNRILSSFECVLPLPGDNIDIFIAIANALEGSEVYFPYNAESLILFQRRVVGLSKLREAGFNTPDFDYFLSERSVEAIADRINFPVEVLIGDKSALVEDKMHLMGMIRLRREGQTILLKEPVKGPVIECMVVGNDVVASVETREGKRIRSVKIGGSLQELAVNATKTLGSAYGFISLSGDKIVSISLSSNLSAIEKVTNQNVSESLLIYMRDNARVLEKSILEKIIDALKVAK